jgi:hypothetical protein
MQSPSRGPFGAAVASHSISFALWEKSVNDQQQMLAGKAFKSIPTQAVKN